MTYREIFDAALAYLCESTQNGNISDYEERACYILATGVSQCLPADKKYRQLSGAYTPITKVLSYVKLSDTVPLSDIFAPALTYYLASMLCIDENEELSERLFERYSDEMCSISLSLPSSKASISDAYNLLI